MAHGTGNVSDMVQVLRLTRVKRIALLTTHGKYRGGACVPLR